jgi:hypothetical protein
MTLPCSRVVTVHLGFSAFVSPIRRLFFVIVPQPMVSYLNLRVLFLCDNSKSKCGADIGPGPTPL